MRRVGTIQRVIIFLLTVCAVIGQGTHFVLHAADSEGNSALTGRTLTGSVQNRDLRRVDQAIVQVRDQEGNVIAQGVTNQAGEFTVTVPQEGIYSISAFQDTYKSEFVVVKVGAEQPAPLTLTLAVTQEIALEIVSPLPAIQYKASSSVYQLSRKDIEAIPRGNNIDVPDVLLTVPSVAYGALKQTHIRQDHAESAVPNRRHSDPRYGHRRFCGYRPAACLGAGGHHCGRHGGTIWE